MIRILLGQKDALWRELLTTVLSQEEDLHIVAGLACRDDVLPVARRTRPDILVFDVSLPGVPATDELCAGLIGLLPECGVLMLSERSVIADVGNAIVRLAPRAGLVATDATPRQLIDGIRQLARGKPVLDIELAVAAVTAASNPLSCREREVLRKAVGGAPVKEIAGELFLSVGTVRNYLTRIVTKTGARTRIEAIRIAQDARWI